MLKPEVAQKELEKFKSARFVEERVIRLGKVPAPLRPSARTLFDVKEDDADEKDDDATDGPETESFWEADRRRQKVRTAAFRALDATKLGTLLTSAFPGIAPYLRRALDDAGRLPYASGWSRKPFRAPRREDLLARSRVTLLRSVSESLKEYPDDVEWIATWAAHAWPYNDQFVGPLLAAAIDADDAKGRRVFDILVASAKGDHEIGQMGRHVVAALLTASRPDGWEFIEKMLLAAQREEGLRQTILELVDECHPEAFTRFLRVVLEHELVRFSATVRAVDTWFGFLWDAMSVGKAKQVITHALRFLDDPAAGNAAIATAAALAAPKPAKVKGKKLVEADDAVEPAYIALWAKAFVDVDVAIAPATGLLDAANPDVRFVATHLLAQLGLGGQVSAAVADRLEDADERVAARALSHFMGRAYDNDDPDDLAAGGVPDLFERLERLIARAPAKTARLAPIVWPWMALNWGKATAGAALIRALGDRPASRLLPHFEHFDASTRQYAAHALGESKTADAAVRRTLLSLIGDASAGVRGAALKALEKCTVTATEAAELEPLLSRKASDLRRAVLSLLATQDDTGALASADRLTGAGAELLRLAGLDLLRQLAAGGRSADACRQRALAYRESRPKLSIDERTQLDALAEPSGEALTLEDCLGLIDPAGRTKPAAPRQRDVRYVTPAAVALLKGLDDLVHEHREQSFKPRNHRGDERAEVLLGNCRWEFPSPDWDKPAAGQVDRLPLADLWLGWFDDRPKSMRDADGLELIRALWLKGDDDDRREKSVAWIKPIEAALWGESVKLKYASVVSSLLAWLDVLRPAATPAARAAFLLDGLENVLAMLPPDKLAATFKPNQYSDETVVWRHYSSGVALWAQFASGRAKPESDADKVRLYQLLRWIDEPGAAVPRNRAGQQVMLEAFAAGGAVEADLFDHLLGPRESGYSYRATSELGRLCSLKQPEELAKYPAFKAVIGRCRDRVLEVELARGEAPTIATGFAHSLCHAGGLDVLLRFLRAAEKNTFARGYSYGNESKAVVFSHVIRATYPADGEAPERFASAAKEAGIPEARLVELAVYAPQWAAHVEHAVGWPHLAEAVWWTHAHTRDRGWSVDADLRERWTAEVAQRTPLSAEDLLDGAVDVAWFNRTYEGLGKKRWDAVYGVAKFAASGGGHKRAQLFADAMLGRVKAKELVDRINAKRNQDAVRGLGLLPLPKGDAAKLQILSRYKTLQEFIRTSRQFGSMRQTSEKRAAAIGMENLARTAGYPDPIRLQWAMEALACADLAKGPVSVSAAEVTVSLAIDADGDPEVSCVKKGKPLAAIPPAARKNPKVAALAERKTELKRSRSRMRVGLEQAMVRGDEFSGTEVRDLTANPLLAPLLGRLVFVGEGILGYPVDKGRGLKDHAGKVEPIKATERLRIAHPHDLLKTKKWTGWQHECFAAERVQPFKQVFRELYVATKTELDAKEVSRRYAGHQVQPRQALALLGARGWVTAPEQGVFRTFHDLGLTAWLTFQESFYTPADIEGLTLEGVRFTSKGEKRDWTQVKDVPPRAFSEVMRDLDLVVSVAHRGGVDPEASASTLEMRATLLSETLKLLGIKNVRVKDAHALVEGELAKYSIHLGSAVTHRQPGGALFIVPVHSQHRGRLFLPFADDDPKTAEVISKTLLLARDTEIKDPNLLAQIRTT